MNNFFSDYLLHPTLKEASVGEFEKLAFDKWYESQTTQFKKE